MADDMNFSIDSWDPQRWSSSTYLFEPPGSQASIKPSTKHAVDSLDRRFTSLSVDDEAPGTGTKAPSCIFNFGIEMQRSFSFEPYDIDGLPAQTGVTEEDTSMSPS